MQVGNSDGKQKRYPQLEIITVSTGNELLDNRTVSATNNVSNTSRKRTKLDELYNGNSLKKVALSSSRDLDEKAIPVYNTERIEGMPRREENESFFQWQESEAYSNEGFSQWQENEEYSLEKAARFDSRDGFQFSNNCNLSVNYINQKKYKECEELLLRTLTELILNEEIKMKLVYNLSVAYLFQEKFIECEDLLEEAVLNCSGRIQAKLYNSLAIACNGQKKYNKAKEAGLKGLKIEGCSDSIRTRLGTNLIIACKEMGMKLEELIDLLVEFNCALYISDYVQKVGKL